MNLNNLSPHNFDSTKLGPHQFIYLVFVSLLLAGCDLLPRPEFSESKRADLMRKSLESQCHYFKNCMTDDAVFNLTFSLAHKRTIKGQEIICNPIETRLDEYYGEHTTLLEAVGAKGKSFNKKCVKDQIKNLVLTRADPTGKYDESYHVRINWTDANSKCAVDVLSAKMLESGE
jgi:hypothetical protein